MVSPTVLVPAYAPGPHLIDTITDLRAARPDWSLLVVDDGSGQAYAEVFAEARVAGAEVLTLATNRGKGGALKAGFAHIAATRPGAPVVCADADGQHALADIVAVGERLIADPAARRMVLGTRTFDGDVPARSRIGNTITRWLFTAATRTPITDTQTGLRGLPAGLLGWACAVPGERYEYELQALLRAGRSGIALESVPIATIYLDDNSASHFRPVADSLRIYLPLLAFLGSSLASFVVDLVALLIFTALTGNLLVSVAAARLTSAGINFLVNRTLIFDSERRVRTRVAATRYAALALTLLGLNYLLLASLTALGLPLLVAKILTELTLVPTSFAAQRSYVFAARSNLTASTQPEPTQATGAPATINASGR